MIFGSRFPGAALFLGGALFVLAGCAGGRVAPAGDGAAGAVTAPGPTVVIPGVPFLPQEEDTCGPSSLAMLLRYLGKQASVSDIVRETRTEGLKGTLVTDLAETARRRGVSAEVVDLTLSRLRGELSAGRPVILLVDLGTWVYSVPHYLLAYGFTPIGILAHSGRSEGEEIPFAVLDARWEKMGRLAIVVKGAGK